MDNDEEIRPITTWRCRRADRPNVADARLESPLARPREAGTQRFLWRFGDPAVSRTQHVLVIRGDQLIQVMYFPSKPNRRVTNHVLRIHGIGQSYTTLDVVTVPPHGGAHWNDLAFNPGSKVIRYAVNGAPPAVILPVAVPACSDMLKCIQK